MSKPFRTVTPGKRWITRDEYVANVKANNQKIADVFMQYEERLRRMEALVMPLEKPERELSLVKPDAEQPKESV